MKTPISIVIPVSSLVPESVGHRLEAVQAAVKDFYHGVEVIVVEQSLDGSYYFLPKLNGVKKIELKNECFNKGWCCNVGVKASTRDYVVIADSDMCSRDVMWDRLHKFMVENKHKWAFAWSRLIKTKPGQRVKVLSGIDMPGLPHTTPQRGLHEGGLVCIKKSFYYEIGQMNEHMRNVGGIDNEIIRRCMCASEYVYPIHNALVYHLFHPQRHKSSWKWLGKNTRKENIKILKKVQNSPTEAIDWMTKQEMGNPRYPLVDRKGFME
jgi:hypothetical protein